MCVALVSELEECNDLMVMVYIIFIKAGTQIYAVTVRDFYASDIFNERELRGYGTTCNSDV